MRRCATCQLSKRGAEGEIAAYADKKRGLAGWKRDLRPLNKAWEGGQEASFTSVFGGFGVLSGQRSRWGRDDESDTGRGGGKTTRKFPQHAEPACWRPRYESTMRSARHSSSL